jgi:type IV secretory pathway VirB10-like protein
MSDLAERVQRVRTLLETLEDPYPRPRNSLRPDSGPAASRYVPCDTCRRSGWIKRRRVLVLCLACDGQGWRRRQAGEQEWDSYLALPVTEAVQLPVEATHRPPEPPAGGGAALRLGAAEGVLRSPRQLQGGAPQPGRPQPRAPAPAQADPGRDRRGAAGGRQRARQHRARARRRLDRASDAHGSGTALADGAQRRPRPRTDHRRARGRRSRGRGDRAPHRHPEEHRAQAVAGTAG